MSENEDLPKDEKPADLPEGSGSDDQSKSPTPSTPQLKSRLSVNRNNPDHVGYAWFEMRVQDVAKKKKRS